MGQNLLSLGFSEFNFICVCVCNPVDSPCTVLTGWRAIVPHLFGGPSNPCGGGHCGLVRVLTPEPEPEALPTPLLYNSAVRQLPGPWNGSDGSAPTCLWADRDNQRTSIVCERCMPCSGVGCSGRWWFGFFPLLAWVSFSLTMIRCDWRGPVSPVVSGPTKVKHGSRLCWMSIALGQSRSDSSLGSHIGGF